VLGRGEQDHAAGVPDRERGLDVPAMEDALDAEERGTVQLDQVQQEGVDREQPLRQGQVRRRMEGAVVDRRRRLAVRSMTP